MTLGILSYSSFISANLISASARSFSALANCFLSSLTFYLLFDASASAAFLFFTTLSNCFCNFANLSDVAPLLSSKDWQNSNCWFSFSICSARCSFTLSNSLINPAFVFYSPAIISNTSDFFFNKFFLKTSALPKSSLNKSIKTYSPSIADYIWLTLFYAAIILF